MKRSRCLILAAILAATAAIGFSLGKITTAPTAEASAAHRYKLRVGDKMTIPAVRQFCALYTEGGVPELFCSRSQRARHQVSILRDRIQVWKARNTDGPVWSGKP